MANITVKTELFWKNEETGKEVTLTQYVKKLNDNLISEHMDWAHFNNESYQAPIYFFEAEIGRKYVKIWARYKDGGGAIVSQFILIKTGYIYRSISNAQPNMNVCIGNVTNM